MAGKVVKPGKGDALIIVDLQKDFLPGGALPVPHGMRIIPIVNSYIHLFKERKLPVIATRDWHPPDHCSFKEQGGLWPTHCVQGTQGADFAEGLDLPEDVIVISKATNSDEEAYSGFQGTDLDEKLKERGVKRLFIGGLATDYCVLSTIKDAVALGYKVCLLKDAVEAVNVNPGDAEKALEEMESLGAVPLSLKDVTED